MGRLIEQISSACSSIFRQCMCNRGNSHSLQDMHGQSGSPTFHRCTGPFFEVKDYLQFVNREGVWASDACRRGSPNPVVPGLVRLVRLTPCTPAAFACGISI